MSRTRAVAFLQRSRLHTSSPARSSLFNLGGLSTSRESQYFSKERGLPRTEFSPHLELIRSSEVDTQNAPGSRRAKSQDHAPKPQAPLAESTMDLIQQSAYLKLRVSGLQQRLQQVEQSYAGLSQEYKKKGREAVALAAVSLGLFTLLVFYDKIQNAKARILATWQEQGERFINARAARQAALAEAKEEGQKLEQGHAVAVPTMAPRDPEPQEPFSQSPPHRTPERRVSHWFWAGS